MRVIRTEPLTASTFAVFGDLLAADGDPDMMINQDMCARFHDRARLDFGPGGRAGISIFSARARSLPYTLEMMERHPEGSQAFIPMSGQPFLVIVAPDTDAGPGLPRAFLSDGSQAINFHRNIWHGALTPLHMPGLFAVVDRIGDTKNLQEHWFETPFVVRS